MYKDYLELMSDDIADVENDNLMSFMYKPTAVGLADPDGANWPWQINVWRKDDWGDSMFYDRNGDTFAYVDEKILSEDVNQIHVFLEGKMYEVYQLLMNGQWQYTNLHYGTVKIGTPDEIHTVRSLLGIPLGGWA